MYYLQRYSRKLAVTGICVFVVLVLGSLAIMYRYLDSFLESRISYETRTAAIAVSEIIAEDAEGYRVFARSLDAESEYYKRMKARLEDLKSKLGSCVIRANLFIDGGLAIHVLDSEPLGSDSDPLGAVSRVDEMMTRACESGAAVTDSGIGGEKYASRGVAPIIDPYTGDRLGVVSVDFIDTSRDIANIKTAFTIMMGVLSALIIVSLFLIAESLSRPMFIDGLTKIYNKKFFMSTLKNMTKQSDKHFFNISLLFIDLDNFSVINEKYGIDFGDQVLQSLVLTTASVLRGNDLLARYGGEEFVALLPIGSIETAGVVAKRIREAIEKTTLYDNGTSSNVTFTISVGTAEYKKGMGAEVFLAKAQAALAEAKILKNRVVVAK